MADRVTLAHGSGGRAANELVRRVVVDVFGGAALAAMEDAAVLLPPAGRLVVSTDSFVVDPLFFPGGDIGALAVHGTINDLAMRGGRPLYLTAGMILEEGLPLADLERIVRSMKECADRAGVEIVAGDTKVVPAGKADRIFINTTGLGETEADCGIAAGNGRAGDRIILSGTMADHGATVLCRREGLAIGGDFRSDTAPLHELVALIRAMAGTGLHVLRDPTRGGVATALNELAQASGVGVRISESELPVRPEVRGACELLGLDPLYLANEGKLLAFVAPEVADQVLAAVQGHRLGREARLIGEATEENPGRLVVETAIGGRRVVGMLHGGDPLPRIC